MLDLNHTFSCRMKMSGTIESQGGNSRWKRSYRPQAVIITHVAFYAGWPKGWAVFNMAKELWDVEE